MNTRFTRALLCAIFIFFQSKINAQVSPTSQVNSELRHLFENLSFPSSSIGFLYERSAKLSDSTFHNTNSNDTLTTDIYLQVL